MAALFSTRLETTPPSDLHEAAASPREVRIRLFAMGLVMAALLLFAGWILLIKSASGLEPGDAMPGSRPASVTATQYSTQVWRPSTTQVSRGWTWEKPAIRFDTMYRNPR
jgi:hypothetical protein